MKVKDTNKLDIVRVYRQIDKQIDRQTDRQGERQTDIQIDFAAKSSRIR